MAEFDLGIEAIFKKKTLLGGTRRVKQLIQNRRFEPGFRITNIGTIASKEVKVKSITISSMENKTLHRNWEHEFQVRALNPNETTEIWLPEEITHLTGLCWISMDATCSGVEDSVVSYQKLNGKFEKYVEKNTWGDSIIIDSQFEIGQSKTNSILLLLTIITTWEAIFGIRKTLLWILKTGGIIGLNIVDFLEKISRVSLN